MLVGLVLVVLGLLATAVVVISMRARVVRRYHVTWPDGLMAIGTIKPRRFPWFSDNITPFGWVCYAKHWSTLNEATVRHELGGHGRQYHDHGHWWVWTRFLGQAEREAKAIQFDTTIIIEELPL
jgi:hypothetical protein